MKWRKGYKLTFETFKYNDDLIKFVNKNKLKDFAISERGGKSWIKLWFWEKSGRADIVRQYIFYILHSQKGRLKINYILICYKGVP